jgi:hypothetical protein
MHHIRLELDVKLLELRHNEKPDHNNILLRTNCSLELRLHPAYVKKSPVMGYENPWFKMKQRTTWSRFHYKSESSIHLFFFISFFLSIL